MTTSTYKGSIQKKFIKAIFTLVSIIIMTGYILFVSWYVYNQKQERILLAKDVTQVLSQDFLRLILLDDIHTASDLTTKLQAFPQIYKVILYNKENKKIFLYNASKKIETGKKFSTSTQLNYNDTSYGKLYFEFEIETLFEIFQDDFLVLLLFLLVFLLFSFFVTRSYVKHFSEPLLYLVQFLEKVEFQDNMKHYKIKGKYDDEIGKLYEEINIIFTKIVDFIQQRDKAQEQLAFLVQYDALTGLLNKNGFLKELEKILKADGETWNSLFYIKLTNLKSINHAYSYKYGDLLLKEFAKHMKEHFSDSTLSARISMGDFILYYQNISQNKKDALLQTQNIADVLVTILSDTVTIEGKLLKPEVHIGIDIFHYEKNPLEILKHTDIALEIGRESHQKIVYFDEANETYAKEMFNIFEGLLVALKENQLELFYQLQYDQNDTILGAEALIRWRHPKLGLLPPHKFIPIAERTDLIVDIGDWVIDAVCKQLKLWQKNAIAKEWVIAINVSAKQFNRSDFVPKLQTVVNKYNIDPKKIKLELLESLFVENQKSIAKKMHKLKVLGFKLSLDDFGTGFSSLQYLKIFPLDQIKIDQSFVMNMFNNEKDIQIIKSIIYLGSLIDMQVIAEGVEKKEHYDKLKELGCHYFQGYYFAKPQSVTQITNSCLQS